MYFKSNQQGGNGMRVTLLSIILMVIGAVMMGCTDNIIPCTVATEDVDCAMDYGWDGNDAADWDGGDYGMTCDMTVSPLVECQEMAAYLNYLPDFLPIDISIDCDDFLGKGEGEGFGVCGSSFGFGW
jgi:hypothetical protein